MTDSPHSFLPMSRSPIWQLQRHFFQQRGIAAWRKNLVPYYVTSNPFIAGTYVQLVAAFLEDLEASSETYSATGEPSLIIVELGAGAGQFSFYFLQQFFEAYEILGESAPSIRYVMTDISHKNINFWKQYPRFQAFIEKGVLDFAYFDICGDADLALEISGQRLPFYGSKTPMVTFANYVFDSIPQDVFEIRDGGLFESLISIPDAQEVDQIRLSHRSEPCSPDYYRQPHWNQILKAYGQILDQGYFLFPVTALHLLDRIADENIRPLLLLTADKGHHLPEGLISAQPPELSKHGSFSIRVNYHAMLKNAQEKEAEVLATPHAYTDINVLAFVFGNKRLSFRHVKRTYQQEVVAFGPDDFFSFKNGMEKNVQNFSLEQLLFILRLSRWDPVIFDKAFDQINFLLPTASGPELYNLRKAVTKIQKRYFGIKKDEEWLLKMNDLKAKLRPSK